MRYYAGIGSRSLLPGEYEKIVYTAKQLYLQGWTLYSGNCDGADHAFQQGSQGQCVLWLPWQGFGGQRPCLGAFLAGETELGNAWTDMCHPRPSSLSAGARKLINRDAHQVLGWPGYWPPVSMVVYVADEKQGVVQGGTGQAVRVAKAALSGVRLVNLRLTPTPDPLGCLP